MTTRFLALALAAFSTAGLLAMTQRSTGAPDTVWVAVNVVHEDGHLVSNLTANDFEVLDHREPREITTFRNDPIPVAVALMVDISDSMQANYGLVRRAMSALTSHFAAGDRAIVGAFDALPWIGDRFSARPDVLARSLTAAFGGTLALCDGDWIDKTSVRRRSEEARGSYGRVNEFSRRMAIHGGSAIWDGAACGINAVASDGETPRRIVVLVTDGLDTMSWSTVADVVSRANRLGVMIYAVSVMGGYGMAGSDLRGLAEQTGGGYFHLTGEDQVAGAFTRIADELRYQYVFGFTPAGPAGGTPEIVVRARLPKVTTRYRQVQMELPTSRPLGSMVTPRSPRVEPGPTSSLPGSFSPAGRPPGAPGENPDADLVPERARTALWDTLDRFMTTDWPSGVAPRMSLSELRAMLATLRREAPGWMAAASGPEQGRRRIASASFTLDLLYSQNDPYVWLDRQPAPDLMNWAATILEAGPPTTEERTWYLGAMALFERGGAFEPFDRFVLRAMRRFPDEPRFVLARGIAQDLRTWPEERDVRRLEVSPQITALLVSRYEAAAALPDVRREALLRLAYFELRRGRIDSAIARFDTLGDAPSSDPILEFWHRLLEGRALEQAMRLPEAMAQFEQALDIVPAASSARAALIAVLAKANRPQDAARFAARALSAPAADVDPWTLYLLPDMRFWTGVTDGLRRAVAR